MIIHQSHTARVKLIVNVFQFNRETCRLVMNGLFVSCGCSASDSDRSLLWTNVLLWSVWPLQLSVMNHQGRPAGPRNEATLLLQLNNETQTCTIGNWEVCLQRSKTNQGENNINAPSNAKRGLWLFIIRTKTHSGWIRSSWVWRHGKHVMF